MSNSDTSAVGYYSSVATSHDYNYIRGATTRATSYDVMHAMLYSIHSTIAYELMTLEFPYKHLPLECLIFRAGCGETQSLELISNRHFKTTISKCWNPIPQHRPSFKELVTSLEQNVREEMCTQYTACCYISVYYTACCYTLSILYSLLLQSQYTIQLVVTLSVYYTHTVSVISLIIY